MNFQEQVALPDNLYWAWAKLKRHFRLGDVWFDELEMARFEANLDQELRRIADDFSNVRYSLSPLRPLPHPKADGVDSQPKVRQAFWVSVRDQVAWLAFTNVIGPRMDATMPSWSYGNRLYRSIWTEEANGISKTKVGWYRHSSGNIYKKFHHSWPRFRRHIHLTTQAMAGRIRSATPDAQHTSENGRLDETELRALAQEDQLPSDLKLRYLVGGYWETPSAKLYWASIDFSKFYPSTRLPCILDAICRAFPEEPETVRSLASQLLTFPIDVTGWSAKELKLIGLTKQDKQFHGIPTGLCVAGFLANVAMLPIDQEVDRLLNDNKGIAHFRFVDDHVILAHEFEKLVKWLRNYEDILRKSALGVEINWEKLQPQQLEPLLRKDKNSAHSAKSIKEARVASSLDPDFPAPLMTNTLALVSALSQVDFDLMDEPGQRQFLVDVEHLLLADLPDTEIKAGTRVSFAATMLAKVAGRHNANNQDLAEIRRSLGRSKRNLESLALNKGNGQTDVETLAAKVSAQAEYNGTMSRLVAIEAKVQHRRRQTLQLLLKALKDHPDRIRLWHRTLGYCQQAGIGDLSRIMDHVQLLAERNPLSAGYYRSSILVALAHQTIQCARTITNQDALPDEQDSSWEYLLGILKHAKRLIPTQGARFYEVHSVDVFRAALGSAHLLMKSSELAQAEFKGQISTFESDSTSYNPIDWSKSPERWASKTDFLIEDWAWWAEILTTNELAVEPGPIWTNVAPVLDPRSPSSHSFLARHPSRLITQMGPSSINLAYKGSPATDDRAGWFLDFLSPARNKLPPIKEASLVAPAKKALDIIHSVGQRLSLYDWWAPSHSNESGEFDPRFSEWTSVVIINYLARRMQEIDLMFANDPFPIHPANFLVPESWTTAPSGISWQEWSRIVSQTPLQIRSTDSDLLIHDSRYSATWPNSITDRDWACVRGLGMMFLGLACNSFEWPGAWNVPGQQRAHSNLARTRLNGKAVSSWTRAIIEGCLLARPRETLLLKSSLQTAPADDDTSFDPPQITNLNTLERFTSKVVRVLVENQLTVQDNKPRQLVPVKLEHLTRPIWQEDFPAGNP